jgi:probable F420-dependent oxidoreductase
MELPLDSKVKIGLMTRLPNPDESRGTVELLESLEFDSLWVGDHVAFTVPILDPLLQLAHAAAYSRRLIFGTSVYLLPLRHPTPVAKQMATLDHLTEGRFIAGVGVGGEFPNEYAACGVPVEERGARLSEGISVLRKLWSGKSVENKGRFYSFPKVRMQPSVIQQEGPPIWCGGRSQAALKRAGRMADGYVSYVVTPEMYKSALGTISESANAVKRQLKSFGTGHLVFMRLDNTYESAWDVASEFLSVRYAMDFRRAAQKYAVLGRPEDVAEQLAEFYTAGVRHFILDMVGPSEQRDEQLNRFAKEVRPLLPIFFNKYDGGDIS